MSLSDSDFSALLWSLDLLYIHLAICSIYLLHEGPLASFSCTSVSSFPDPVTSGHCALAQRTNPLAWTTRMENCHFGKLPGTEYKLGGIMLSLNNTIVFEMKIHFHRKKPIYPNHSNDAKAKDNFHNPP